MKKENFFGYDQYIFGSDTLEVSIITLGATVRSIQYRGRETVLNYPDVQGYLEGSSYIGAAIGRFANRIGGSRFVLNGKEYCVTANEGENQLHGGPHSYDKRVWEAEVLAENSLRMTIHSPDGDNGFPGNLTASVTYTVEDSSLRVDFEGVSDADTVYAPTTHFYFKLDSACNSLEHELWLNSDGWLEVDNGLIPTGRVLPNEGKFDFSRLRPVTEALDHCFTLKGEHACTVRAGQVQMDVYTDLPALQIYTATSMEAPHGNYAGLAVEPEFYPDSPNQPAFPSVLLRKGEQFHRWARFVYSDC